MQLLENEYIEMDLAILWDDTEVEFPASRTEDLKKALKTEKFVTIADRTLAVTAIREIRKTGRRRLSESAKKKLAMEKLKQGSSEPEVRQVRKHEFVRVIHIRSGIKMNLIKTDYAIDGIRFKRIDEPVPENFNPAHLARSIFF